MTDEPISGEIVLSSDRVIDYFNNSMDDLSHRVAVLTKGGMTAEAAKAWNSLIDRKVPEEAVKTRPGGKDGIPYVAHQTAQEYMNAAWGHLWDMEVLSGWINPDGSANALVKVTFHIPVGKDEIGNIVYHDRVVQEVGSFEAYWAPSKKEVPVLDENGTPKLHTVTKKPLMKEIDIGKKDIYGTPMRTMTDADRIASAASRALPRIMMRAFDWGTELYEPRTEMTIKDVYNQLLSVGKRHDMNEEQVVELMHNLELKAADLLDDVKYAIAWTAIHTYHKELKEVPEDL
jgi:hypothetical protein